MLDQIDNYSEKLVDVTVLHPRKDQSKCTS